MKNISDPTKQLKESDTVIDVSNEKNDLSSGEDDITYSFVKMILFPSLEIITICVLSLYIFCTR